MMTEDERSLLTELVAKLETRSDKKKDWWDRLSTVSTFLSTVVLGALGLYFTHQYNEQQGLRNAQTQAHQTRILEMQTVEKFIPHLTGEDEERKKVALLAITSLGSAEFATQFAQLSPSAGTEAAADQIMRSASPQRQTNAQKAEPTPAGQATEGWAYVGHYVASTGRWKTRYFDVGESASPSSLVGNVLHVREQTGSLNVREDMPSMTGSLRPVQGALKAGAEVEVIEVKEWLYSGYIWAKIRYGS